MEDETAIRLGQHFHAHLIVTMAVRCVCYSACVCYHIGQLTAEVKNVDGAVPVEIVQKDRDKYSVSFIPRIYGELPTRFLFECLSNLLRPHKVHN